MDGGDALMLFFGAVGAMALVMLHMTLRHRQRRRFLQQFDFALLLDKRLARRRPELAAAQRETVFGALREWFLVCQDAGARQVSMPSQVVDDAWHEFILFTRNYEHFCRKALGRFLHHVPAEAMTSPTAAGAGLRRCWKLACARAGINPRRPAALPLLFSIDADLAIADGFRYELDCRHGRKAGAAAYCASHLGCSGDAGCSSSGGSDGGCGSSCGGGCGGGD